MQPLKANLDELQENEVTVSDNTEQAPVVQQSVKTTKKAKRRSVARKTVAVEEPVVEIFEENKIHCKLSDISRYFCFWKKFV